MATEITHALVCLLENNLKQYLKPTSKLDMAFSQLLHSLEQLQLLQKVLVLCCRVYPTQQ